jgi:hypothetical protein
MTDVFDYELRLGWLGKCVDSIILKSYMATFLRKRAIVIKAVAEATSSSAGLSK